MMERFKRLHPPYFSGLETEDENVFLDRCYCILFTLGLVESNKFDFTTFQLSRLSYKWL